ncbi:MAG: cystathionine gamma-synthase [Candidatus Tectomicrobia bacterium RIFCSPLOWO2_12_FULL_69_37]|nr:MAG: cystathionine gamma-synthase [Candidatus Tectomicrobia bacterium RIFCSPLOWO2_02_FULL_70_19]OGL68389.1 MAG: cystathionine gamma-synthase [Candidatus Tectomicrobia bacterium RIFCSPLOWO2_12_FULL_69_37]
MRIETLAVRAGRRPDPATGAVAPPIVLSTTFERAGDGSYPGGYVYSRTGNPNRGALESCLAALEGGEAAAALASGQAAALAVFLSLAPGDHVLLPEDAYHGTARLAREILVPWGLEATFADLTDLGAAERSLRPNTRLIWAETPSNPLLKVTDLAGLAGIAKGAGARLACDNTWATPILQRPLALGADLAVHAATKYIGGHSDLTLGIVVAKRDDAFFQRVRARQHTSGAVPSPFDCWLALRGAETLPVRMRAHSEGAQRVAEFLAAHPAAERVHYPGLPGHPGRETAMRQMSLPGGMVSFEVGGGAERALAVAAGCRLFTQATSLGGNESLIEHRASVEGSGTRTPPGLLRLSVGLEHPDDLIEDLKQALG